MANDGLAALNAVVESAVMRHALESHSLAHAMPVGRSRSEPLVSGQSICGESIEGQSLSGQSIGVFRKILILCVGNICRSPTAEYLLRRQLAGRDVEISSAGLGALVGHPVEGHALDLLQEHGIDASPHRARQLDVQMLRDAELVLGMERRHLAAAARLAPEASGKLFLLGRWLEFDSVPDPYRQPRQAFEDVYGLIERGVGSWVRYL
jgi:protein-tyrosine phosphatase